MKSRTFNRQLAINLFLSISAVVVTLFIVITSPFIQEGYDLHVGSLSPKRFVAPSAIKDEFETQKLIDAAINGVAPLYKQDIKIEEGVLLEINDYFTQEKQILQNVKVREAQAQLDTPGGFTPAPNPIPKPASKIAAAVSTEAFNVLKNKTDADYEEFRDQVLDMTKRFFDKKIAFDANTPAKTVFDAFLTEERKTSTIPPQDLNILDDIVSSVITYSFIMDEDATIAAKNDAVSKVKPVIIQKGQKIIDEGEIISEHVYAILDSLNYVNRTDFKSNILPILGVSIIIITLFVSVFFYLYTFYKKIFIHTNQACLLYTLYMILIVVTRLMVDAPYMFIPILTFTMLIAMLIAYRAAIILNLAVSFICLLIYKGDLQFFTYFALTGIFTPLVTGYTNERNQIIFAGVINAMVSAVMITGMTLFFEKSATTLLPHHILYALISGLLTLILSIGSLPFWEAVFGIVTSVKLLELVNPNNKLIRKLMIEAPGTYHHSLIVSNLAEAAAYDIGANAALARVGGYFHDVGKLKYPQYFTENIAGENLHDSMDPYHSVDVIASHVSFGMELCQTYKIPKVVQDIVYEHHGTTLIKFFYHKAKEQYAGDKLNEKDFRYPYQTPQSKESAIVMMSDTVEAAIRSVVTKKDFKEIEAFIKQLIKDKLDDGQLTDSGLSLKEIDCITKSFMGVFRGMYHERIPYPEDKRAVADDSRR